MSFSRRHGLDPKKVLQTNDMDRTLRIGLWNVYYSYLLSELEPGAADFLSDPQELRQFSAALWIDFLKRRVDERRRGLSIKGDLSQVFETAPWNRVYDLLEFTMTAYPKDAEKADFRDACNSILEREMSAYRIVGDIVTELTSEQETEAITRAQEVKGPVETHLVQALRLLSNREKPDYRNSIKESISAVEAMCQEIAGERATLGQAIKKIEDKTGVPLRPALREAFGKLYGWTSDSQGIRHALADDSTEPKFEEAMLMLVTCSAFINYLRGKTK